MIYNMWCVLSITLIFQDVIYKVKTAFNNEFDAVYKQKEFEVARVKERNVRIQEIILDLDLEEVVWQPEFDDCEKPERTLVVENKEVLASCVFPPFLLRTYSHVLTYSSRVHYWKWLFQVVFSVTRNKTSWHCLSNNENFFWNPMESREDLDVKPRKKQGPKTGILWGVKKSTLSLSLLLSAFHLPLAVSTLFLLIQVDSWSKLESLSLIPHLTRKSFLDPA